MSGVGFGGAAPGRRGAAVSAEGPDRRPLIARTGGTVRAGRRSGRRRVRSAALARLGATAARRVRPPAAGARRRRAGTERTASPSLGEARAHRRLQTRRGPPGATRDQTQRCSPSFAHANPPDDQDDETVARQPLRCRPSASAPDLDAARARSRSQRRARQGRPDAGHRRRGAPRPGRGTVDPQP